MGVPAGGVGAAVAAKLPQLTKNSGKIFAAKTGAAKLTCRDFFISPASVPEKGCNP